MRALALTALLVLGSLAGCVSSPIGTDVTSADLSAATPPVVVAVLDTGINPYHVEFRGGPGFEAVSAFPADARAIELTLDAESYAAAVEADAEQWAGVSDRELVWFPGTRLAAYSLGTRSVPANPLDSVYEGKYQVLDGAGHGTVVTDAVFAASEHAVVVMVKIEDDWDLVDAMEWVAEQPWIDIVTVSMGTWSFEYAQGEHAMGLPAAYAKAHNAGKLVLNAAGNEPVPHFTGEHHGPPFIVAVGGAENATRGDNRLSARFPDVMGPMWQTRASKESIDEYEATGGTSLACPWVAGVVADGLWHARDVVGDRAGGVRDGALVVGGSAFTTRDQDASSLRSGSVAEGGGALADGVITNEELRDAMNRRAELWGPTDWAPPATVDDLFMSQPVVAAAAQMGWGYVEPAQAVDIGAYLVGELELPEKPHEVVEFMRARDAARYAVWGDA